MPERWDETDTEAEVEEPDEEEDEMGGAARELAVLALVLGLRLLPPLTVLRSSASELTKSSKSPSKTPSSSNDAEPAALRFAWFASSRLSIRIYSTASASLRPRFSSPARCSRSRPYARLECSASSLSRPYDSWIVLCNST